MNRYQGVVIVVATRINKIEFYDSKLLKKLGGKFLRVLIVDKQCRNSISKKILSQFDQLECVKSNLTDSFHLTFDPLCLRESIKNIISAYETSNCYVFCEDEDNIEIIAEAIHDLGVHGYTKDKAYLFRNKVLMKAHLEKFDIRMPKHFRSLNSVSFENLSLELGVPFIIKPKDGVCSFGFSMINCEDDFENWACNTQKKANYLAEEYIDGKLYHVDSTVYERKEVATSVSEYLYPVAMSLEGCASASLLVTNNTVNQKLLEINSNVLNALAVDGNFHAEYFITSTGEVIFLEIAWRQSGSPGHLNFKQFTGMTQASLYMGLKTGLLTIDDIQTSSIQRMQVYIPKKAGIYRGLNIPLSDDHYSVLSSINEGDLCENANSFLDIVACIEVNAPSHQSLYQDFLKLREVTDLAVFE